MIVVNEHNEISDQTDETSLDLTTILTVFQIINISILILTISGCSFVLLLFYKERKHRKIAHNYVISMCLADIVHGGLGCGMVVFFCTGLTLSDYRCPIVTSVLMISVYVSLFSLTTTAIDRYLAVCHPLRYRTKVTHHMSFGIIITGWIVAIITGICLVFMRSEKYKENPDDLCLYLSWVFDPIYLFGYLEMIMFVCVGVTIVLYINIYTSLRKMFKSNLGRSSLFSILDWIKNESESGQKIGLLKIREVRVTLLMFITVVSFALCWLPCTIVVFLYRNEPNRGTESILVAYAFPKFYSMINPIFYAYTIKDVRNALKRTIDEVFCRKNQTIDTLNSQSETGSK